MKLYHYPVKDSGISIDLVTVMVLKKLRFSIHMTFDDIIIKCTDMFIELVWHD